jgi:hypothetical protein
MKTNSGEQPFASTLRGRSDANFRAGRPPGQESSPVGSAPSSWARRTQRKRHQVVLQLMPGAEAWLRVEHSRGWFRVPACISAEELLQLVADGVRNKPATTTREATVRVPLSLWRSLQP